MASITLENRGNRMLTIALVHPSAHTVSISHTQAAHDRRTGKVGRRIKELQVADSIIIPVGGSKAGLPDYVQDVPDVRAFQRSGDLRVIVIDNPAARRAKSKARAEKLARMKADVVTPTADSAKGGK